MTSTLRFGKNRPNFSIIGASADDVRRDARLNRGSDMIAVHCVIFPVKTLFARGK